MTISIAPLQYPGRVKYNATITGTYGPGQAGTKTLPAAPALFAAIGTTGGFFDVNGVPQPLTHDQGKAAANEVRVFKGDKWELWYSADQYDNIPLMWESLVAAPYDTFTASGNDISSAIATGATGVGRTLVSFVNGDSYNLTITLDLNSGTAPFIATADVGGALTGDLAQTLLVNGVNNISFSILAASAQLIIYNLNSSGNYSATILLEGPGKTAEKALRFAGGV